MTIYLENETDYTFPFPLREQLERIISFVIDYVDCPYEPEVSVTVVSKDEIQVINKEFRNIDKPTDVLSFPMMEYEIPGDFENSLFLDSLTVSPESEELILGDIVLCQEIICEQAKEYGHSEEREFSFLVVHSMLHLFGYDHMEEEERILMENKQKEIMEQLGIHR